MSLEAEVGSIGGEEDGVVGMGECADPNECKRIADLGVDSWQLVSAISTANILQTGRVCPSKLWMLSSS